MASRVQAQGQESAPNPEPQKVSEFDGWTLHEFASVDSTNFVAAHLPAWHAVRADTQTAGRGRFQRTWISDLGGLWLSAVVPVKPAAAATGRGAARKDEAAPARRRLSPELCGLPLVAGLAVCEALRELGVEGLRMRWPNDVLVYNRKLAGLLLDQFHPDRVVVGIGLNVRNTPEARDTTLKDQVAHLADFIAVPPPLAEVTRLVLGHLRRFMLDSSQLGFAALLPRVNTLWGPPRRVELALDSGLRRGLFTVVDQQGCLVLQDETGGSAAYDPTEVRHLQEI